MLAMSPFQLVEAQMQLIDELVPHAPRAEQARYKDLIAELKAQSVVIFKPMGRGGHWKFYRENQEFNVDIRGEGSHVVRGVDNMAAFLGWKVTTLRSKLAVSKGTISTTRQHEGREQVVIVSRVRRS